MHRNPFVCHHKEPRPVSAPIPHDGGLAVEPAREAPPAPDKIDQREAGVAADRERGAAGGVDGKIGDALAVCGDGLKVDEGVGVVDANGAIVGGGEEVAGEAAGGGGRGVESEGGDGAAVVEEGADLGSGGEVVELDGVVGAAGRGDGAGGRDGLDGADVGGVGEEGF